MDIIFVTSKLNFETAGGSIEEIDYLIHNLIKLGHKITVVTAYSSRNIIPKELPYRVIEENIGTNSMIGMQRAIYKIFHKYQDEADFFLFDTHRFLYGAGFYRLVGGRVPVGGFVNQWLYCFPQYFSSYFSQKRDNIPTKIKRKLRWIIERYLGRIFASKVDIYAYVSPFAQRVFEEFWENHRPQDVVTGDPVDIFGIMKKGGVTELSYRERLKRNGQILLFFSSRMSPGKGFDMFLQGFSRVKNKDDFRVILPGWVDKEQLYQYYREADVFIQADWWKDGTSISLLYALAFGVPSILPGGGGLQWNAGEGAVYFPYHDVDALARRIEELGADPDLRARLSTNCYTRIKKDDMNYPKLIEKFAKRMEEIRGDKNAGR